MLYLALAFTCSALVSIIMRLSERKIQNNVAMLVMNYAMCSLLAACYCGGRLFPPVPGLVSALGMGTLNGALYLISFVLLQENVRRNGVVLSSTFMKLGLLVCFLVSVVCFGEVPGWAQILGFCLAVAAIVLINYRGGSGSFRPELLALLLGGGMADAMSKVFEELGTPALADQFLFYTFLTAGVLCVVLMLCKHQKIGKWELLFGLAVGIPNFLSSKFLLAALAQIPAVVAYPVYSVAGILLVTLAGVVLFRERLTRRQWIAIAIILAALALLNR